MTFTCSKLKMKTFKQLRLFVVFLCIFFNVELLNLNKDHPFKKLMFLVKSLRNQLLKLTEVMITSFIEMLKLPNFGPMNRFTI